MKRLQKICLCFVVSLVLGFAAVACSNGGDSKCKPACGEGMVCFAEDGTNFECKKSCTKDEDCEAPMVCHTDENPAHCGEDDE